MDFSGRKGTRNLVKITKSFLVALTILKIKNQKSNPGLAASRSRTSQSLRQTSRWKIVIIFMFMMIDDDQADHGQDYDKNLEVD